MLSGLLLAAGGSERLGEPKQLVDLNGTTLVRRTASLLLNCADEVVVVSGAHRDLVESEIRDLPLLLEHNEGWASGMGSSIAVGMRAVSESAEGVLILLCDQWRVDQRDLARLVREWRIDPGSGVCAEWKQGFGPPAIFPARLFGDLKKLRGVRGAKALIRERPEFRRAEIPNARFDLDTAEDLQVLLSS